MAEAQEQGASEEIAALEQLLAEKKQALAAEGKNVQEREAFREAFRESFSATITPSTNAVTPPLSALSPDELAKHANDVLAKAREEQVDALIEIALRKGVRAATHVAKHATPWLMDELHDRLQDRYYDQLIQLRKLKAL
jgi:hypothetical protein